jgi:hypothetical protein
MPKSKLTREQILSSLKTKLESLSYTNAMWEGGAAAFDRVDEWSDIDLQIDVRDEYVAETFKAIEQTLIKLSPIELQYELPQPTWHGHAQAFYRLKDAGEFLLLDLCVIKGSNPNKFLQPEIHNQAVVHFDKCNVVRWQPLNSKALTEKIRERLETLRVTFDLFQMLTKKEINRKNDIEALSFYHGYTLRPLIEALRIKYVPTRYNFHTRYVHYELPKPVVKKLESLYFVRDRKDLAAKRKSAESWFNKILKEINMKEVVQAIENSVKLFNS